MTLRASGGDAQLLPCFTQRRLDEILARLKLSAGQPDLIPVMEDEAGPTDQG